MPITDRCSRIIIGFSLLIASTLTTAAKVETLYKTFCHNCHGPRMNGGLGGSLIDKEWKHGSSDEAIAKAIREGIPQKGMPAWKKALTEEQIRAMVIYIRERGQQARTDQLVAKTTPKQGVYQSSRQAFTVESVATGFKALWAMDFLPDGSMLVTEKEAGKLWRIDKDKRTLISGIPTVWPEGQGGLMEVRVLPTDKSDPWVYLSYSEGNNNKGMTAIIRGKIIANRWQQQQEIFHAPSSTFLPGGRHFGSRIAFTEKYLFFSIGDRGHKEMAQDLTLPNGKIHRLLLDGKIPPDNPFINRKGAMPSIWSYGHRNPQGMTLAEDGALWITEHGPRGGDEINLIEPDKNYGWPLITHGMNYNGTPITKQTAAPGLEQPQHYWTPSIAVTAIDEYTGNAFPAWQGNLIIGSLAKQELQRFTQVNHKITGMEVLLKNRGRIRDVIEGPDGLIYLVINTVATPREGAIYQLKPAAR